MSSLRFENQDICITIEGQEMTNYSINLDLNHGLNKHSMLNIEYTVPAEENQIYFDCLDKVKEKILIEVIKVDEEGQIVARRAVFEGLIRETQLYFTEELMRVKLRALSNSILLDEKEEYRSYQDMNTDYGNILNEKNDKYGNVELVAEELSGNVIGEPIIQYDETDWQFFKRIMAKVNKPLLNIGAGIRIGFLSSAREYELPLTDIIQNAMIRDNKDYTKEIIKTREVMGIGEKVKFESGEVRRIIGVSIYISNGAFGGTYTLVNETDYQMVETGNFNIAGKAIEGKIVEVLDVDGIAKMTVNFNTSLVRTGEMIEDENGNSSEAGTEEQLGSELFKFPYVTPYSQSHTGYFCTPEVNDNVVVYFPTEKESDGFVIGTVNSAGNGRFTDRFNRNFIIPAEGSENGQGIDSPQYNMTLANNVFGVTTGTTNTEVEYENLTVSEDSVTTVSNDKSVTVENDMNYTITNNKNVQVDNNLNYTVSNDYQADVNNYKISANANVEAQGTSAVNIKGMEVKVEADTQANLKGGAMVQVGAPQVSIGS